MPYISEKINLSPEYDRRRKLSDEQKEEIFYKYHAGLGSQRSLAKEYNVSRSLIRFIVMPEKLEHHKELARERRKDGRYKQTKEEHAKTIREHRRYKQKLYLEGKLGE